METCSYYADGKWLEPASGEYFDSENPYSGETWARIPRCNEGEHRTRNYSAILNQASKSK